MLYVGCWFGSYWLPSAVGAVVSRVGNPFRLHRFRWPHGCGNAPASQMHVEHTARGWNDCALWSFQRVLADEVQHAGMSEGIHLTYPVGYTWMVPQQHPGAGLLGHFRK